MVGLLLLTIDSVIIMKLVNNKIRHNYYHTHGTITKHNLRVYIMNKCQLVLRKCLATFTILYSSDGKLRHNI